MSLLPMFKERCKGGRILPYLEMTNIRRKNDHFLIHVVYLGPSDIGEGQLYERLVWLKHEGIDIGCS